jgi:UDP-GlcNAc:undecaprenyl-phosphate GlcNAc-1-phosphate transferase
MGVRAIAGLHWGFAAFHALLAWWFTQLPPFQKPLVVFPALLLQCAWLAYVARRVRRAGLSWAAR